MYRYQTLIAYAYATGTDSLLSYRNSIKASKGFDKPYSSQTWLFPLNIETLLCHLVQIMYTVHVLYMYIRILLKIEYKCKAFDVWHVTKICVHALHVKYTGYFNIHFTCTCMYFFTFTNAGIESVRACVGRVRVEDEREEAFSICSINSCN